MPDTAPLVDHDASTGHLPQSNKPVAASRSQPCVEPVGCAGRGETNAGRASADADDAFVVETLRAPAPP